MATTTDKITLTHILIIAINTDDRAMVVVVSCDIYRLLLAILDRSPSNTESVLKDEIKIKGN